MNEKLHSNRNLRMIQKRKTSWKIQEYKSVFLERLCLNKPQTVGSFPS